MSSIVYVIEGGDREDELEEHVLKIKFSLDILKKYINHGKSLPLDGDENLILPLKLPKNINIHQLSKFFEFFKENKKNKKPIAKTVLKGQQHKNFVYVYANVDDEKKALQEHYTQFSSFVREMDDQLLLQIYQLVGHLHCDRLQKILMVFLRERQPKKNDRGAKV